MMPFVKRLEIIVAEKIMRGRMRWCMPQCSRWVRGHLANQVRKNYALNLSHVYTLLVRRFMNNQPIDIELPKALPKAGQSSRIAALDCAGRLKALRLLGKSA